MQTSAIFISTARLLENEEPNVIKNCSKHDRPHFFPENPSAGSVFLETEILRILLMLMIITHFISKKKSFASPEIPCYVLLKFFSKVSHQK